MFLILVCLFLCECLCENHPCEGITKNVPISYSVAKGCIYSVEFDENVRKEEINYVLEILEYYIFKDIATDSGPPLYSRVDVFEEVRKISSMSFEYDYDFKNEIRKALARPNDAHLAYLMNYGFRFYQPFPIRQKSNREFEIYEHWEPDLLMLNIPEMFRDLNSSFQDNRYKSARILSINGLEPYEAIKKHADEECSYSRDPQIRFNYVLSSEWHSRSLTRVSLPDEFIEYTLEMPDGSTETIEVPWVVVPYITYKEEEKKDQSTYEHNWVFDSEELKRRLLEIPASTLSNILDPFLISNMDELFPIIASEIRDFIEKGMHVYEVERQLGFEMISEQSTRRQFEVSFEEPIPKGYRMLRVMRWGSEKEHRYFRLFLNEEHRDIALLKVISFMPNFNANVDRPIQDDEDEEGRAPPPQKVDKRQPIIDYVTQMYYSFKRMRELRIKKVILDVRGNGGGIVCFSDALLSFLSPYAPINSGLQEDMIYTDLMSHVYCKDNPFMMAFMVGVDGESIHKTAPEWYRKGELRKRGGKMSQYSKLYRSNCEMVNRILFLVGSTFWIGDEGMVEGLTNVHWPWKCSEKMFEPEDILVLTDGTCGSTCGTFVSTLQSLKLGKVVNMGGQRVYDGKVPRMSTVSFAGGGVATEDKFIDVEKGPSKFFCPIPSSEKRIVKPEKGGGISITTVESYPVKNNATGIYELGLVDDSTPLDFVPFQADFHLNSWDFGDDIFSDPDLLGLFDVCLEWEIKRDDKLCKPTFENAVYGHPCGKDGKFIKDQCVIRGCERGYYLSVSKDECIPMPEVNPWGWIKVVLRNTRFQIFVAQSLSIFVLLPLCILCCCCFVIVFIVLFVGFFVVRYHIRKRDEREEEMNRDPVSVQSSSSSESATTTDGESSLDDSTTTTSSDRVSSSSTYTDWLYFDN